MKALLTAAKATERNATCQIINYVRVMQSAAGVLAITGTDLEHTIEATAPGTIGADFCVNARDMVAAVRANLGAPWVASNDTVTVGDTILPTLPVEDFPAWTQPADAHCFDLQASDLTRLLGLPLPAVSTEETRYYLNGVFLHACEGMLRGAGTDGHKLIVADSIVAAPAGLPAIIVPGRAVKLLMSLKLQGVVTARISPTRLTLTCGGVVFTTKLIDGTFPQYDRVIPEPSPATVTVSTAALLAAVKREKYTVTLSSDGAGLTVKGSNFTVAIPGSVSAGQEALSGGFQAKYIAAMLTSAGSQVTLSLSNRGGSYPSRWELAEGVVGVLATVRT